MLLAAHIRFSFSFPAAPSSGRCLLKLEWESGSLAHRHHQPVTSPALWISEQRLVMRLGHLLQGLMNNWLAIGWCEPITRLMWQIREQHSLRFHNLPLFSSLYFFPLPFSPLTLFHSAPPATPFFSWPSFSYLVSSQWPRRWQCKRPYQPPGGQCPFRPLPVLCSSHERAGRAPTWTGKSGKTILFPFLLHVFLNSHICLFFSLIFMLSLLCIFTLLLPNLTHRKCLYGWHNYRRKLAKMCQMRSYETTSGTHSTQDG